jgi:hypothetical protein
MNTGFSYDKIITKLYILWKKAGFPILWLVKYNIFWYGSGGMTDMLQQTETIRHYQKITDAAVEMWHRGYRFEDLRLYLDGYVAALRAGNSIEAYQISRLEEEAVRYIYDPSNFELRQLQTEPEADYRSRY